MMEIKSRTDLISVLKLERFIGIYEDDAVLPIEVILYSV